MESYKYYVGCDLGEVNDYSAASVIERSINYHEERGLFVSEYSVRELIRWPLQTPYPVVVDQVKTFFENPYIYAYGSLIVDKTGVGRPVIEMMQREGLSPLGITITGGNTVTQEDDGYNVPKKEIVSAFLIMAQTGQFHISGKLELAQDLKKELESFQVKINKNTGHEVYGGEGEHDDLVICIALPLWYAHKYDTQMQTLEQMSDAGGHIDEERNAKYNYLTGQLE